MSDIVLGDGNTKLSKTWILSSGNWQSSMRSARSCPPQLAHHLFVVNEVLLTQPWLLIYILTMAALVLLHQNGVVATETTWAIKSKTLLSGLYRKSLQAPDLVECPEVPLSWGQYCFYTTDSEIGGHLELLQTTATSETWVKRTVDYCPSLSGMTAPGHLREVHREQLIILGSS